MLKTDLHTHSSWGRSGEHLEYSARELIKYASKLGYEVLALTEHNCNPYNYLKSYAKKHNILLVPGVEINVGMKHVLVLNTEKGRELMHCDDFEKLKNEQAFLIAPHPFFPHPSSMKMRFFMKHKHLFDALEHSWFYSNLINFNRKVHKIAEKYKIPVVANSDCHNLKNLNRNYSWIDADKNIDSVLEAIRKNRIRIHTEPLGNLELIIMSVRILYGMSLKTLSARS
jgi:predicted metal-dependent phosphoesterase TrpH